MIDSVRVFFRTFQPNSAAKFQSQPARTEVNTECYYPSAVAETVGSFNLMEIRMNVGIQFIHIKTKINKDNHESDSPRRPSRVRCDF